MPASTATAATVGTIRAADGRSLGLTTFPGRNPADPDVVVVAPAAGVPQRFYADLARAIAERGPTVITFDYRGIGASRDRHPRQDPSRMRDWGQLDIDAVIRHADTLAASRGGSLRWLGQSAGACFLPLADARHRPVRIVTVSALSGYWGHMVRRERLKLAFGWYAAFPLLVRLAGYAPKRIWGGEDLSAGAMRDWGRWCRDPDYFFGDPTLDTGGFADTRAPILAVRASDDPWATAAGSAALHDAFTAAPVERMVVTPEQLGVARIGHIDLLRASIGGTWWPELIDRLLEPVADPAEPTRPNRPIGPVQPTQPNQSSS
jgi:predicted alpha/beta hydrolase